MGDSRKKPPQKEGFHDDCPTRTTNPTGQSEQFSTELDEALEQALRRAVVEAVKMTLEAALEEEVKVDLAKMTG